MTEMPQEWEVFPLAAPEKKCGLRTDLPKKERRHLWVELGTDVRHVDKPEPAREMRIRACRRCGTDKQGG
jgi:hypothetical protein